jgi:hypothetical protein
MPQTTKDYKGVKHSSAHVTPDCESVSLKEKQLDFSKFNEHFTTVIFPHEAVCRLEELRLKYMELSLHALMEEAVPNYKKSFYLHEDVGSHICLLSELIKLINEL